MPLPHRFGFGLHSRVLCTYVTRPLHCECEVVVVAVVIEIRKNKKNILDSVPTASLLLVAHTHTQSHACEHLDSFNDK